MAGFMLAVAAWEMTGSLSAPFLATAASQLSFGFADLARDPASPDAVVFAIGGLFLVLWLHDRPWHALALGVVGVFIKETVAVYAIAAAIGAIGVGMPYSRKAWLAQAAVICVVLLSFHVVMDRFFGWTAQTGSYLSGGSWLWRGLVELGPRRIPLYLFVPFGLVGCGRSSDGSLRRAGCKHWRSGRFSQWPPCVTLRRSSER